jgi:membrane associated rhomboid family serine protease
MFPIGDDNREITTTPWATYALILVNVAVFFYELSLGSFELTMSNHRVDAFINHWGLIPRDALSVHGLVTIFTAMFLHGGIMHIVGNMLYLKIFGDNVEDRMGHGTFLVFYFVCGFLAFVAHIMLNAGSTIPSVGASGAISGVLGAYVVMFARNRVRVFWVIFITWVPAWLMIGIWAAEQFLNTYAAIGYTEQTAGEGIAYAAHAGGFIAGVIGGLMFRGKRRSEPAPEW